MFLPGGGFLPLPPPLHCGNRVKIKVLFTIFVILQVVFLYETNMAAETKKKYELVATTKYVLWLREYREEKQKEVEAHGNMLYSRFYNTLRDQEETGSVQYQCTKKKCRDYGKTFKSSLELEKHEG